MTGAFARDTLTAWLEDIEPGLTEFIHSKVIDAPQHHGASVGFELPGHLVSVCAWDQGNRLEVTTIDVATEETVVEDLAYEDRDQLQARLDELSRQLLGMRA